MRARAHLKASIGVLAATSALVVAVPVAQATYLGQNGKISFDVYDSNNQPTVYTMDPNGSNRTPIAPGGGQSAWSADGQRIAFACQSAAGQTFIPGHTCTAAPDGSAVAVLDDFESAPQQRPFWSPDGRRLIIDDFQAFGHGSFSSDVWRIDSADGGDPIHMATGYSGSWSPNGQIVYAEHSGGSATWVSRVFAVNPNSSVRLTEAGADGSPDWSPDGTKIVFVSCRPPSCELYTMNSDGSNETPITSNPAGEQSPAWSPDGSKILFARDGELYLVNPDGTGETDITNTPGMKEFEPHGSPFPNPAIRAQRGSPWVSLVRPRTCQSPNRTHGPPLRTRPALPPSRARVYDLARARRTPHKAAENVTRRRCRSPGLADDANVRPGEPEGRPPRISPRRWSGQPGVHLPIRITDKLRSLRLRAGDVQDFELPLLLPCAGPRHVDRLDVRCHDNTDALVPQAFRVPRRISSPRPIVDLAARSESVYDGREDGFIESNDDNTMLAVQESSFLSG